MVLYEISIEAAILLLLYIIIFGVVKFFCTKSATGMSSNLSPMSGNNSVGDDSSFARLLSAHRLPGAVEDTSFPSSAAVSDMAKLRAAMESHPLESIDALARLRHLEDQETAGTRTSRKAWYEHSMSDIVLKTATSVGAVVRETLAMNISTPAKFVQQLTSIVSTDDRQVYLLIFSLVVVVLLRTIGVAVTRKDV